MNRQLYERIYRCSTCLLADSAKRFVALDSAIKPIDSSMKMVGRAYPVKLPPEESGIVLETIAQAKEGDVLVIDTSHTKNRAVWGEMKSTLAKQKKLGGVVIDGCYRDHSDCVTTGFPLFAKDCVVHGSKKEGGGQFNVPISIGGISVCPGDWIVGDENGVIVLKREEVEEILLRAGEREQLEEKRKKDFLAQCREK